MTKMNGRLHAIGRESAGGKTPKINSREFRAHCARFLVSKGEKQRSMADMISLHAASGKAAR